MSTTSIHSDSAAGPPVGPYVRGQIVARLREAMQIATSDLSGGLDRFRDLLTEAVERVDGISLPMTVGADDASVQPASHLAVTALGRANGRPVDEFLLIPFGEVVVERPIAGESFVFTPAHAKSARRWFDGMGRKLAIDYEHQTFDRLNTRADGLRPAAGWIGGLEVREDGLWAVDVTWTERARELLGSGEYRYFSPVIFWTDEDRVDVAALGPVALTNDPAMHGVRPLAAARRGAQDAPEADLGAGLDGDERVAAPPVLLDESVLVARVELDAAHREIGLLRRQLEAQEADTFVERGLRLGKILDSTSMDWRADYLRDPEATEERLARSPVLLPPGRMLALDRRGEVACLPRTRTGNGEMMTAVGQLAVEPEDLAAFERATAAGRVLMTGALAVGRAV